MWNSAFFLYIVIRPSQIEILYLWTSFFLEDKNAVDYKSRSIFSQSYLKLKVFFLFLFTITTVAHSNFGEVNVKFFTLCRLVFQHSCWWANFISFYVPLYKNFLVIFRAMYDDFVFKRFPLAKVIFLRAPMPKWLFMPTEHAETCYLRLTMHFLFQKCFCFKFCDGQICYEYCFHISGSKSLLHGFLHSLGRFLDRNV